MSMDFSAQIERWRSQLLDTTKRNQLIQLKLGNKGPISISHPSVETIWEQVVASGATMSFPLKKTLFCEQSSSEVGNGSTSPSADLRDDPDENTDEPPPIVAVTALQRCLASPDLLDSHILTDLTDVALATRLGSLAKKAKTAMSEQGVPILFFTYSLLKWFESDDSQVEILSPLMLFPAELDRDSVGSPWQLRVQVEEVLPNHALGQLLQDDFQLRTPRFSDDDELKSSDWRDRYIADFKHAIRDHTRWQIVDHCCVGVFSFQKIAMWEDLGNNREQIASHELCRAIAGDGSTRIHVPEGMTKASELDKSTHPNQVYHILDADSSQHEAIEAAKRGASLILDGPPGTGKSQTIANIIAEFLAVGKSVLFVSEKAAALKVVKRRLDHQQLGDFCLECHNHNAKKKTIVEELKRCLGLVAHPYHDQCEDLDRLFESRQALNDYVKSLHEVRQPIGLSAYQVHGKLAAILDVGISRVPLARVEQIDGQHLRKLVDLLKPLPDYRELLVNYPVHPWRGVQAQGSSLHLDGDINHHFARLSTTFSGMQETIPAFVKSGFMPPAPTIQQWLEGLELSREILSYPLLPVEWFERKPRQMASGFIQLDQATQAYRRALADLPEFVEEFAKRIDLGAVPRLPNGLEDKESGLLPHAMTSIATLRDHLKSVSLSVQTLNHRRQTMAEALQLVFSAIGLKSGPFPARWMGKVNELFQLLKGIGPLRRSWLDAGRRIEIQKVIDRCRDDEEQNVRVRTDLLDRMLPKAFDSINADLIMHALPYKASWRRASPGWLMLKPKFAILYIKGVPETSTLIADLQELAGYHQRVDYARQIEQQFKDQVVCRCDGELDRDRTKEGLRQSEQIEPLVRLFPDLQDKLVDADRIDRIALTAALEALNQRYSELRQSIADAGASFDLTSVLMKDGKRANLTLSEFGRWLNEEQLALDASATSLDHLCNALKPGKDLPVADLQDRVKAIRQLRQSEEAVTCLIPQLDLESLGVDATRNRDWSDLRSKAEWTLEFLERHRDQPSEPLVRATTLHADRPALEQAVRLGLTLQTVSFTESWQFLNQLFDPNEEVSTGIRIGSASVAELSNWIAVRRRDVAAMSHWFQFHELRGRILDAGLGPILTEISRGEFKVEDAANAFLARFYKGWLDSVYQQDVTLRQFSVEDHERTIGQFRDLDQNAVRLAHTRIRESLLRDPDRPSETSLHVSHPLELGVLLREINKKRNHLPLRHLFARLPNVLLKLKPCVMMSPLAVSTFLESKGIRFDLVIFDEASQVRPHDAISAIYRGKQLVVAGDQKQLPPTDFFDKSIANGSDSDGDDEAEDTQIALTDFESILDVCSSLGMPRRRLRWHYRSRREPLIAFANHYIYEKELVTFPSVHDTEDNPAIRFDYVKEGCWKAGKNDGFNLQEARRTARLVFDHFRDHPDQSLGVIAFSEKQKTAIDDELERLRRNTPALEGFFKEDKEEPFFLKNLENVQGDERDVIFLCIGYGPDEKGKVSMRFGPLNRQGGERRLNVAITRARSAMTVISSLKAHDIDLSKTEARGAHLLRAYLDFAERGSVAIDSAISDVNQRDFDSPFEKEVSDALVRSGLTVRRQVGCSGFRIDLALVDPDRPGRFLLGIECDGATYHSSATARDRDRLRQAVLESLGWTIVRIWSTDWVKNPDAQIDRVVKALELTREHLAESDDTPRKIIRIPRFGEPFEIPLDSHTIDDDAPGSGIERLASIKQSSMEA